MKTKKGFNRFVSVLLSFAIVISTFAGLSLNSIMPVSANTYTSDDTHFIIKLWHATESENETKDVTLDGFIHEDKEANKASLYIKDGTSDYVLIKDYDNDTGSGDWFNLDNEENLTNKFGVELKFNYKDESDSNTLFVRPKANDGEEFAGFAVSAGNDCVDLKSSEETPYFTIKYGNGVHIVKVHAFYSEKPKLVPGTEMTVGTEDSNIGKYEDTKTQTWKSLGDDLQKKIKDAIADDRLGELLTGDGEIDSKYIKLYNTSEGLHTDKTATPVYNGDENDAGTTTDDKKQDGENVNGTRVFDINLEAWYNDQAIAKVGLILDASGSMAFISDGLTPMHFDFEEGNGYKLSDGSYVQPKQYLTPDQVNKILDKNLTDNSKLSYSGYTYYIFDARDFTQEFVPLAYWGGDNGAKPEYLVPQYDPDGKNNHLLGFWDFNETGSTRQVINEVTGKAATVYQKDSSGKYTENQGSEIASSNFKDGGHYNNGYTSGRSFALSEFSKNGNAVALDVKPTSNTFTVSFIVGHVNDSSTYDPERILFIGDTSSDVFTKQDKDYNSTSGYNFYEIGKGDRNHLRFGAYNKNKTSRIDNVFDKKISTSSNNDNIFHFVTMVFSEQSDGKVKYTFYKDGKLATNNSKEATGDLDNASTLSSILESESFAMMLGGDTQSNNFKIYIDDLFLFDTALSDTEVEKLYNNVKKIDENGYDATDTPASVNAVDSKGNVFATFDSSLTKGDIENRAGWYFVNSGSDLEIFYNEEVGTAKILCGLRSGEVIANEIDLTALPKSVQDFFDKKEEEVENGNGGYIATEGTDFKGKGFLWEGGSTAAEVTVGEGEYTPAITVPDGEDRQFINGNSPCVFFIDSAGYLRCFYNNGGNTKKETDELRSGVSYVYQKGDSTDIKSDDLQYALGQFAAQLHNATPNSMVSAVRFSTSNMYYDSKNNKYSKATPTGSTTAKEEFLKQLILLDWTSDTKEISQILSLERGDGGSNDKVNSDPTDKDLAAEIEALAQYNYGMTGGTYTWTGFQAYKKYLDSRIKEDDPAKKYIILFTDGMDNTLEEEGDSARSYAIDLASELKKDGYTIFCVVLKNKTFDTSGRGGKVEQYMADIAGNETTSEDEYNDLLGTYIFEAENVEGLTSAFTGEILSQISSSLIDYSVQDYIDPRFDLVDRTGNTIVLGKGGKVTIKDTEGNVTKETTLGKVPEGYSNGKAIGTIHNIDGAEAVLCYDSEKDRYYLEWVDQNIPGTTPKENSLTIWSRTFRIKAKEDFIGGNAILSNGKEKEENWVFNPNDESKNSGVSDAKVNKDNVDDTTGALNDPYVSKGFPRTTVNVRLLKPSISDASDEIYMGETISPKEVAKDIIQIVKNDCYWDYLGRYYSRDPLGELEKAGKTVSSSSYDTAFENAIADLLDGTVKGTDFKVEDYEGLNDYLTSKGIDATKINTAHKLEIPYMYLPDKADTDYTNTVGDENYQKDRTGTITYMIIQNTPNDELGSDVLTKDTKKRSYIIWVQFTADQIEATENSRSSAITELLKDKDTDYTWDKEYKPAAGEEQKEKHIAGPYEVDIVAGEIILEWELSNETLAYLKNHFPGTTITYNADLMRSYNGLTADEKVGTFTVVINCDGGNTTTKATFAPDESYKDRIPAYGLPIGTYTLLNEKTTIGGESATDELKNLLGECFKFDPAKAVDVIEKYYEHFKGYSDIETVSATYNDTEKAELKAEHSDKAVYLGWNGTTKAKTTDYLKDRLGVFLIKGDIDTGTLSITKTVQDKINGTPGSTPFTFTVEFKDSKGGNLIPGSFTYSIDGDEKSFTNGDTITLTHGQTAEFKDLPFGTYYTVTEVTDGMASGYEPEKTEPVEEGAIDEDNSKPKVEFVNIYGIDGTLELNFVKNLLGREWNTDEEYTFVLTPDDTTKAALESKKITVTAIDGVVSVDADHNIIVTAKNGNNIPVKLTFARNTEGGLPITYKFTVVEQGESDDNMLHLTDGYDITIDLSNGAENNGKYDVVAKYVVKDSTEPGTNVTDTTIPFNNQAKVDWSFDITKKLSGRNWKPGDSFSFDISLEETRYDEDAQDTSYTDKITISNDTTDHKGTVNVTFYSTGTYTFTVTENTKDMIAGVDYDTAHTIEVTVDTVDGKLAVTKVTVDKEEVGDPDSTNLEITNTYKVSGDVTIDIPVQKDLTGRDWLTDEKFEFTISAADDATEAAVNEKDETKEQIKLPANIFVNSQGGTAKFGDITFKNIFLGESAPYTKTFTFKVSEVGTDKDGITYAKNSYEVTVTISDGGDGEFSSKVEVKKPDNTVVTGNMVFTNVYEAAPVEWAPSVTKELEGRKWKNDDKFTFNIELTEGNSDNVTFTDTGKTVTINGTDTDKTKSFEDITFSDAGKYTFTVSEVTPTDKIPGVAYSETKYTVTVTVADDGLGKLYVETVEVGGTEQSDPNNVELSFTNTYTAKGEAEFKVQKTLTGRDWKEGETFTFTLEADDDNPTGGTITLPEGIELGYDDISETATDKTIAGNTFTIEFEGISFDDADAKTYTYYLTENKKEPSNGINYDGNRYTIKVTVTDNGDGTISTKVMVNEIEGATAEFTNTYKATNPATWEPSVTKELEGRDWIEGDSFKFTITADNNNPKGASLTTDETITIEGTDAGTGKDKTKSFGGITFNEVGEYKFTISEVKPKTPAPDENGRINGIEYSKTEYTVTVTIADDGEGNLYVASISYTTNSSTEETTVGKESVEGLKFSFTNVYTVQPVEWTVTVEKQIIDRENTGRDKNWTDADKFEFTIEPDKDNPAKVTFKDDKTTIEINNKSTKDVINGIIRSGEFGAITFSEAGTYKFTVAEKDSEVGGILYDTNVYTLTVDVKDDNNGRLYIDSVDCTSSDHDSPEPTISDNNTKISLSFINVHDHTTVSWVPSVTKDLKGRDWNGDSFNFKLEYQGEQVGTSIIKDTNKVTMGNNTAKVTSEGITYFSKDTVVFHEIGTYVFTISEVKPTDPKPDENGRINGIKYSDTKYEVIVTVKDDGTGKLFIDSVTSDGKDYANQSFKFENDYTASGTAGFTVQKTLEGRDWKEGESFRFIITADHLRNPIDSTVILPESIELSNEIGKLFTIEFENITFKEGETEKTYYFTLKENDSDNVPGMTYDKTEYEIRVTVKDEDHDGKLETTVEVIDTKDDTQAKDNVAAFTNTYKPASTSWTLKVSKTLTGRNWINGDSFTFNITLDGTSDYVTFTEGGKTVIISGTDEEKIKSFGEITFTKEGTYTFTISEEGTDDNGLTYDKHVYNVKVTVVDDKQGNLNITNIAYTDKESKEITVTSDFDGITFEFENNYRSKSVDWTVTVEKQINDLERTGRDENWTDDDVFTFTITTNNTDGVTFNGNKTVTLSNKLPIIDKIRKGEFGTITFTKAGKYTFTVRETKGTVGGMHYDTTVYTITVTVSDNNEGSLYIENVSYNTNKPKVSDDKTEITLPFTNIHHHDAVSFTPSVTKDLEGRDWDGDSFNFTLEYKGEQVGAELVYDENTHKVNIRDSSTTVESEKTATPFPDAIVFHEIGTYVFTVSEQDLTAEQIAKGLTKDPTVYTIIVTVKSYNGTETGHKDGELYIDSLTVNGKEYDPTKVVLSFTNNYTASGKADVKFKKTINGRKWKDGDKFSFTLTPETGYTGVTIPDIIQLSDDKEATFAIEFKDIAFSEGETKKTYTFTLKEDDSSKYPGMTYDKTVYTIEVTVTDSDHDGELETTVKVIGTKDDVAAFTNTYEPNSTKWTPKVSKTLSGREWKDGDSFTFSIALDGTSDYVTFTEGGKTVIVSGTDAEKIKSFGEITFTKAGTYAFTVSEEGTDGNGLTYDKHVYKVNVTVTDNGNGSLKISSITYEDSQVSDKFDDIIFEFVNKYEPKPVDWTPSVTKVITYKPTWESNYKFDFTITPPTGTDGVKYAENTVTADSEHHTVNFPTVTFTAAGKYEFTVQEKQGDISAVKYDTAPHKIIVTVEDINGTLTITDVSGADTGSDSNLTITNTYSTKVSWPPLVEKNIDGKYWNDGDAFTFTLSLAPDSPDKVGPEAMPDDITLTFADVVSLKKAEKAFEGVKFTEPGTYKFILKESTQSSGNMICDSSQYIITVVVTRDDNGELVVSPSAMKQDASGYTQEAGSYSFTNTYKPEQTDVTIYVEKELDGWKDNDGGFTFDITLTNGNSANVIMPDLTFLTVTKDVPTASFDKIIFTAEGDYEFTVAEREGTNDKIIYAKSQKVTVKVRADESTGKLVASVDGGDSTKTLKFVNHYISNTKLPKGTIIITKVLENWKDGDSFTFEIKLISGNAESVVFADNIATVTATKDAPTASFGDIIFTAEGEYTFTITELSNADDGIIYDTSEYTVTVNVKRDDEHYTLQITDGLDEVNFTFTNSYKTSDDPTPPDEDGDEDEDNPSTGVLPNLTALATATLAMATALFLKKKRSKK